MNLFEDTASVAVSETEEVSKEETAIDKLKEFAEVDDSDTTKKVVGDFQLDFSVDDNSLNAINHTNFQGLEVAVQEEKVPAPVKKQLPESTENVAINETKQVQEPVTEQIKVAPVDKMDYVLDTVDDYANKALKKAGNAVLMGIKRFKNQVPHWLSNYQDSKIHKRFENGEFVIAENFEFFMYQKELMVYRYTGVSQHVVIPDYVGNLPVRYVYRGFLNKNIFDNHKLRSFMSFFKDDNVADLSLDALKDSIAGVKSLQLPKELVYLPKNLFSGLRYMKTLIVPEQVRLVSPSAFYKSSIEQVYFNGDVPKNLRFLELSPNTIIFCKREYEQHYRFELERRTL